MTLNQIIEHIGVTPYYQEDAGVIYNADCLDILPKMPEKCVDLVLTDFPYGNNTNYGDSYIDSQKDLINLISRCMPFILNITDRIAITPGVGNVYKYPKPTWILNWTIQAAAGSGSGPWGFCSWQPILVYGKDPYLQKGLGRRPDTYITPSISDPNGHPCPKPLIFIKWLLNRASVEQGDIVVDPFLGSGTTAVAAKQLGRKYIGIEIEEKYCKIAVQRLAQEILL